MDRETGSIRSELFFIPEHVLPEEYYTTNNKETSFEIVAFKPYRMERDEKGAWVQKVRSIIAANPRPRKNGHRPYRINEDLLEADDVEYPTITPHVPPAPITGRGKYVDLMRMRHRMLFKRLMQLCAERLVRGALDSMC